MSDIFFLRLGRSALVFLSLLAVASSIPIQPACAQTQAAPQPEQKPAAPIPTPAPAPDPGHWVITIKPPEATAGAGSAASPTPASAPAPAPPSVEASREVWLMGREVYVVTTWSDGRQGVLYINGKVGYEKALAPSNDVYILDAEGGSVAPVSPATWPEFNWVKADMVPTETPYEGKACLCYESKDGKSARRAYFDATTHLPVALVIEGGKTMLYEFKAPPSALPPIDPAITRMRLSSDARKRKLVSKQSSR